MRIAVVGLGEAGSCYASALVDSGSEVVAFDPRDVSAPTGVSMVASEKEAVQGADVVLVLTSAAVSRTIVEKCATVLKPGAIYADMTSASPMEMRSLSVDVEKHGATFADVAILGPVIVHREKTPLMISGSGARMVTDLYARLGAEVETLEAPAGDAMAHKLMRSVFMKGLAALVVETIAAGEIFGDVNWIRRQVANQLAGDGQAVIDRFLKGSRLHAERRAFEMEGARAFLGELGAHADVTEATIATLKRLATESVESGQARTLEVSPASGTAKAER